MVAVNESVRFPLLCPLCKRSSGMPDIATTMLQNGAVCVGMRCGECDHRWEIEMPVTAAPTLIPKPDRRKVQADEAARSLTRETSRYRAAIDLMP